MTRRLQAGAVMLTAVTVWQVAQAQTEQPWKRWLSEDVVYLIQPAERQAFDRLRADEERAQFVKQFWERRGEVVKREHYRRIAYATDHFDGWKTDRGETYIKVGPPDEIESHPKTAGRPAYEQWRYNRLNLPGIASIDFTFEDLAGTGNYKRTATATVPAAK